MSTDYELIIEQQDIIKNTLERKQEVCVDTVSPQNKIMIFILKVTTYYSDFSSYQKHEQALGNNIKKQSEFHLNQIKTIWFQMNHIASEYVILMIDLQRLF